MRILVTLLLCVLIAKEVKAAKNEETLKRPQSLEILRPKRRAEASHKDLPEAKESPTVIQSVAQTQPEKSATHSVDKKIVLVEKKPELVPLSYEFSYGTPTHSHIQNKHPDGKIKGRYAIHAPNGQHRTVEYVADKGGFRAGVATNEPGTETALAGGSTTVSTAAELPVAPPEVPHLAPLRIVDIQPFPAPLVRYEVIPGQPAPGPPQVLFPTANAIEFSAHSAPPQQIVTNGPQNIGIVQQLIDVPQQPAGVLQQPAALLQQQVLNQPVPGAQQILVNQGQLQLLSPPDFHVIDQVDVPPQFRNHPIPHDASPVAVDGVPQNEVHAPQSGPIHGHPAGQALSFVVSQPAINVAPPPAVPPPPIQLGPQPQYLQNAQPHQTPHAAHVQDSGPPREMMMESPRPRANTEHLKLEQHRHTVVAPPAGAPLVQRTAEHNRLPSRLPMIQATNDAQIFEVKTKVIDHGEIPFNANPRQLTRNLPFNGPILAAIKVADFSAPRERVRNPEDIFKSLPPPSRRPPPPVPKQAEPLIFLAIPPSAQASTDPPRSKISELSKMFDAMPGPSVHDVAMKKFFNDIKEHHMSEVKFVKKHEHEFQALASRVMPFFMKKQVVASPHVPHPHTFL